MKRQPAPSSSAATVAVVGLGNIGSQVIEQFGRMPGVARVILVDRDRYEASNLRSQRISRRDLGTPKAIAQRRILRGLNPALEVLAVVDDLANVAPGLLQAKVILGCLDSLDARILLNERAWRLGVPWLDAGIDPGQQLVRVDGYRPGETGPCLECALDAADYETLAARHPCQAQPGSPPPTNASSALGALAAALLASECAKILRGDCERSLLGRQVVLDALHHRHFLSSLRKNPECRFDHDLWRLQPLRGIAPGDTLGALVSAARRASHGSPATRLAVEGHPLAQSLHCPNCGHSVARPHLTGRVQLRCPCARCAGRPLLPIGFTAGDPISARSPARVLRQSLRRVGARPGDIVRVQTGKRVLRYMISPDRL